MWVVCVCVYVCLFACVDMYVCERGKEGKREEVKDREGRKGKEREEWKREGREGLLPRV